VHLFDVVGVRRSNLNGASVAAVLNVVVSDARVVRAAGKITIVLTEAQRVHSILTHRVTSKRISVLKLK
jgi:hypothetical protein